MIGRGFCLLRAEKPAIEIKGCCRRSCQSQEMQARNLLGHPGGDLGGGQRRSLAQQADGAALG